MPPGRDWRWLAIAGRQSLREEAAHAGLRAAIVAGQIRPGTIYSAPTLATQFGVSPTPVREVILDLAKEGLITIVKNRASGSAPVGAGTRRDHPDPGAAGDPGGGRPGGPARRSSCASCGCWRRPSSRRRAGATWSAYIEADSEFHLTLLRAGGNLRLVETVADLRTAPRLYGLDALVKRRPAGRLGGRARPAHGPVRGGGPGGVVNLMRGHLRHVRGIWADRPEQLARGRRAPVLRAPAGMPATVAGAVVGAGRRSTIRIWWTSRRPCYGAM